MENAPEIVGAGYACVVAEPHPAVRASLILLLENDGFTIAGTADTGAAALRLLAEERPQLAVLDLHLPGMSAVEIARQAPATTAIVIHTAEIGAELVRAALEAGVRGIALKAVPPTALREAIAAALAGATYVDPAVQRT